MKEKHVRLTVEEIDYLLKGSIHWDDIELRVEVPLRKPIEPRVEVPLGKPIGPKYENRPLERVIADEFSTEDSMLKEPRLKDSRAELDDSPLSQEVGSTKPFLEGNKVYWVLSGVSFLTLGTWIYFVFAG